MKLGVASAAMCLLVAGCITDYGKALNACVDNAKTLRESQECRCHVNEQYGRPCRPGSDAGTDGGSDVGR